MNIQFKTYRDNDKVVYAHRKDMVLVIRNGSAVALYTGYDSFDKYKADNSDKKFEQVSNAKNIVQGVLRNQMYKDYVRQFAKPDNI